MFDAGQTAEEILGTLRTRMLDRVITARLYAEIHDTLPEPQRIRLMGPLDEAHELARAVAALDVALAALAQPYTPVRDELRS
ncbi:hypothetical protein [Novosphingobium sp.]|uniref:hypothetical protein n=1 Tax=Novosphingobium sp. TaxID=1874826 RepID=UPI0038BC9BDB